MTVRKLDITNRTYSITSPFSPLDFSKPVSAGQMRGVLTRAKADPKLGALGADVLKLAYAQARSAAKGDPTRSQVREQIAKAAGSLANERAKGRVNDGYVDKREAALVKGDLAAALYKLIDSPKFGGSKPTAAADLAKKATIANIEKAFRNLAPVVDTAFRAYDAAHDDDGNGLSNAIRKAASDAGISTAGRAAILTAANGATSRGDGDSGPTAADVKRLLSNAVDKLKGSDGAAIVDFAHPSKAPTKKKDGRVTGLELDRTPAATGMTSRALLAYAATL